MATGRSTKPIQDAGWSWVIAAACCWVTFVIQGLVRSSGVIYVSLIDTFEVTRAQASWPFTLRIAVWNLSGPLAGALSYKWSIRTITFVGILIVTIGYVVCWLTSDITIVTVFLGVVQGFGVGISVTLIPVIINQYFSKYKSTGAGIACAGATAGSFALSPIVELTIEEYGLNGAFLLMGGMTLHGILGASLMRPAEWLKSTPQSSLQNHSKIKEYGDSSNGSAQPCLESKPFLGKDDAGSINLRVFSSPQETVLNCSGDEGKDGTFEAFKVTENAGTCNHFPVDNRLDTTDVTSTPNYKQSVNSNAKSFNVYPIQNGLESQKEEAVSDASCLLLPSVQSASPKPFISRVSTNPKYENPSEFSNGMSLLYHQNEDDIVIKGGLLQFTNEESNYNPQINIVPLRKQQNYDITNGLLKENYYEHESNSNDIRHRSGKNAHSNSTIILKRDSNKFERCPCKLQSKLGGFLEPVKAAISVLGNPIFLLIAFNYSVFFLSYMTYLIVIVDYSLDLGISRTDSVFLVSTFSISDLCGRLGSGWITDSGFVKRKNLLMMNMTIVGSLLIATSFCESYMALMAVSVSTGLVVGVNLIIFYALLEEYLGLQKMAMAVGLMNFCIGCLSLITPFLTGVFRDSLGTYIYLFHFLGALSIFCGFLWIIESVLDACRRYKNVDVQDDLPQQLT